MQDLPDIVQSQLSLGPRGAKLTPESVFYLYVPPPDPSTGVRSVSLFGPSKCDSEQNIPLPVGAQGSPRTAESWPPPDPNCAGWLLLPNSDRFRLDAWTSGVIIAASEIQVHGRIQTLGRDLVLLANRIVPMDSLESEPAAIIATPLRAKSGPSGSGGNIVIFASTITKDLRLETRGALGAYPSAKYNPTPGDPNSPFAIHPACLEPNGHGGLQSCWLCEADPLYSQYPQWDSLPPLISKWPKYAWYPQDSGAAKCYTSDFDPNGLRKKRDFPFDYPARASFPTYAPPLRPESPNVWMRPNLPADTRSSSKYYLAGYAPFGIKGGLPGEVHVNLTSLDPNITVDRTPGQDSPGLPGFVLDGYEYVALGDGTNGVKRLWEQAIVDPGGDVNPRPPVTNTTRLTLESVPYSYISTSALGVLISSVADELILPEQALFQGDQDYRYGRAADAGKLYEDGITWLGSATDVPCTLSDRYTILSNSLNGQVAKIAARFDFAGLSANPVTYRSTGELTNHIVVDLLPAIKDLGDKLLLTSNLGKSQSINAAMAYEALSNTKGSSVFNAEQTVLSLEAEQARARLDAGKLFLETGEQELVTATGQLEAYISAHSGSSGTSLTKDLQDIGTDVGGAAAAIQAFEAGATISTGGAAVVAVVALDFAITKFFSDDDQPSWSCVGDPNCRLMLPGLAAAQTRVQGLRGELEADKIALQQVDAERHLLAARSAMYAEIHSILTSGGISVDPIEIARAGRLACLNGQWLTDQANATLYQLERRAALIDAPTPNDASAYGEGFNYIDSFASLYQESCPSSNCSVQEKLASFEAARNNKFDGPELIFLGATDKSTAASIANILHVPTTMPPKTALLGLAVIKSSTDEHLSAVSLSGLAPPVLGTQSLKGWFAAQVISVDVKLHAAVRCDFPIWLKRSRADQTRTDPNPADANAIRTSVEIPPNTGAQFESRLVPDSSCSGEFEYVSFVPSDESAESTPYARYPESLTKDFRIEIPLCPSSSLKGTSDCALVTEVNKITSAEITLSVRHHTNYQASPGPI